MKWVKLRVVQGSGDKRVVKDITIPLEKLNKTCQSRVRQIDVLTEKIAEAATAEEESGATDADVAAGEMPGEPRWSTNRAADAASTMRDWPAWTPGKWSRKANRPGAIAVAARLGMQPAVADEHRSAAARTAFRRCPRQGLYRLRPMPRSRQQWRAMPVGDAWRTSYDAFRANFKSPSDSRSGTVDWGSLTTLKEAHDTLMQFESTGSVSEADLAEVSRQLDAIGELSWEATLLQTSDQQGEWTECARFATAAGADDDRLHS